jgi:transcriptional regulator with XRE-family HTH domain
MPSPRPAHSPFHGTFGRQLRYWRQRRGFTQLALATEAGTTPRHLSFVETGRSRPGQDLILRLGRSLGLAASDVNALLAMAGLSPVFPERDLDDAALQPWMQLIHSILRNHEPFPASAFDPLGRIQLANEAHRRILPGATGRTAEESIDAFYSRKGGLDFENWAEVAWGYADRWRLEATRSAKPELARLAERAERHLDGISRPDPREASDAVLQPRIRVDGEVVTTFSTVLRFDTARDVTLAEMRVELIHPADERSERVLRKLAGA